MRKQKSKTLGDYIFFGKHEFVAFVNDGVTRESRALSGNNLGIIHFGVLVCDIGDEFVRDKTDYKAKFFYKSPPRYKKDSDITFGDFEYSAKVIQEVPLTISTSFWSSDTLKIDTKEFREAKKLLQKYGIY